MSNVSKRKIIHPFIFVTLRVSNDIRKVEYNFPMKDVSYKGTMNDALKKGLIEEFGENIILVNKSCPEKEYYFEDDCADYMIDIPPMENEVERLRIVAQLISCDIQQIVLEDEASNVKLCLWDDPDLRYEEQKFDFYPVIVDKEKYPYLRIYLESLQSEDFDKMTKEIEKYFTSILTQQ